jgi:formylglycine-generating enzyme required for sulfatase activity
MKNFLLTLFLAAIAAPAISAQILQVDPIYANGAATFEIRGGTPNAKSVLLASLHGPGPIGSLGVVIDLTPPLKQFPMTTVDSLGYSYNTVSYNVPRNIYAGDRLWFQGIQLDIFSNPMGTVTNMVSILVQVAPNNPPIAVDDNSSVTENSVVMIDVLANDSDPDGDSLNVLSVGTPIRGTALITNNQIKYTPFTNYAGPDFFSYKIEDTSGATSSAMIYVDVIGLPGDMAAIPAGTFEMGDHANVGWSQEQPVHTVTIDTFYMDIFEVSNAKFADFLNNTNVSVNGSSVYQVGGAGERISYLSYGINYNSGTFSIDVGKYNHPVVNQTWYGAALFCNYLSIINGRTPCYDETTFDCDFAANGFRLPTEAEWEYASRGGEHNPYYLYPWGSNLINSNNTNYDNNVGTTVDVGSYAANGYGLYDMAGNVQEWCNDWYDSTYYYYSPTNNPIGPAGGIVRVLRGGSYGNYALVLRCAWRYDNGPANFYNVVGFRVVVVQ